MVASFSLNDFRFLVFKLHVFSSLVEIEFKMYAPFTNYRPTPTM